MSFAVPHDGTVGRAWETERLTALGGVPVDGKVVPLNPSIRYCIIGYFITCTLGHPVDRCLISALTASAECGTYLARIDNRTEYVCDARSS